MMMGKTSGFGSKSPSSAPASAGPDEGSPEDEQDDSKDSKLLALQNLLGAISELSDEDIRPDIEKLKNQVHMGHEAAEGDEMGVDQAQEHDMMSSPEDEMGGKPGGLSVEVGMGGAKPGGPMSNPGEEDEEDMPKGGFLAILSKKMNKKGK